MEVYILDSLLRRVAVVDVFESLIWTERFAAFGDFELVINSTRESRGLFSAGTRLAVNTSLRVMTVETVEDNTDAEGTTRLTVKGRSLESILLDRVAKKSLSNTTTEPLWVLNGTPIQVLNWMFNDICRTAKLDPGDRIPFLQQGTIYPNSTIPAPTETIRWEQEPDQLYNAITALCDQFEIGFRLVRNFDTSQLYFDFYTGSDRTTQQDDLPAVVFSPSLDNLQNTTEFTTIEDTKNCAYVFSDQGFEVVYPLGIDPEVEGFDRRVLIVKADTLTMEDEDGDPVTPTSADISAYLVQKGLEELSKHRTWSAFDGEHSKTSDYVYEVHYYLGDLVEIRNADGVANIMRVTEQIMVSDEQGDRSYPTLAINQFINPGAWLSWNFNQTWLDLDDSPTTWADQV